jgi:hypothetical protein
MFAGEPDTHNEIVKSRCSPPHTMDEYKPADTISPSPVFNPQDLIGQSFLMDKQSDGQRPSLSYLRTMNPNLKRTLPESNSSCP